MILPTASVSSRGKGVPSSDLTSWHVAPEKVLLGMVKWTLTDAANPASTGKRRQDKQSRQDNQAPPEANVPWSAKI